MIESPRLNRIARKYFCLFEAILWTSVLSLILKAVRVSCQQYGYCSTLKAISSLTSCKINIFKVETFSIYHFCSISYVSSVTNSYHIGIHFHVLIIVGQLIHVFTNELILLINIDRYSEIPAHI